MNLADDAALAGLNQTEIRFLTPDMCRIHLGTHDALHVTVLNEAIYGGVYAAYAFPVAYPEGYISLIHIGADEEQEIGVIRNLSDFPEADAALVRQALGRRYFVHTITRLRDIGWKYGFVAFEVETDKGPREFLMPWRHDRAFDYGRRGKILIDVDENRYLIADVDQLTPHERNEFQRYVYW
jgi:hypothetical protein